MMIACDSIFTNKNTATTSQRLITINPNIKVLHRFPATKPDKHAFNNASAFGGSIK